MDKVAQVNTEESIKEFKCENSEFWSKNEEEEKYDDDEDD